MACERAAGTTKWSFVKLLNYAIEGIIGFSTRPLRYSIYMGSITAVAAVLYLFWVIFEKLCFGIDVPGYATTLCAVLFLGGIIELSVGILGEYIGRIYVETKRRPIYIASETNLDEE